MTKYYPATFSSTKFHCPICGVYASQEWNLLLRVNKENIQRMVEEIVLSRCEHCNGLSIWKDKHMIFPEPRTFIDPHQDMPESVKHDYLEALAIFNKSPRGATALLRLSIQKLMMELGEKGKNINDDIASLVQKGLSVKIQQALDYCRVIGNSAVHPAELNIDDTPEIAEVLFKMINFIIEEMISKPQEIDSLYNLLPESARNSIVKRDS